MPWYTWDTWDNWETETDEIPAVAENSTISKLDDDKKIARTHIFPQFPPKRKRREKVKSENLLENPW